MPLLKLVRLPGVFTAFADILAGYLIVRFAGSGAGDLRSLWFLLGTSGCIYMAGMVWNDIFDFEADSADRPDRPLPSGLLSMTSAFVVGVILSIAGLMLAMAAGMNSFLVAASLLSAVLLYDAGLKRLEIFGPVAMGSCRGLNLLLGMTAHPYIMMMAGERVVYLPPLLLAAYTALITVLATLETAPRALRQESPVPEPADFSDGHEREDYEAIIEELDKASQADPVRGSSPASAPPAAGVQESQEGFSSVEYGLLLLSGIALMLVPFSAGVLMPQRIVATGCFALLMLMLLSGLVRAMRDPSRVRVRALVGASITGIPMLDAGLVASLTSSAPTEFSLGGWQALLSMPTRMEWAGVLLVVVMIIPAYLLRKRISLA